MNIILIGMPSCGKSTIGVLLAKRLGYQFVDTDLSIQEKCGCLLQDIIDTKGSVALLRLEQEVLLEFKRDAVVVATGGSAVYSDRSMEHLKANGTAVYIKLPVEVIEERLTNFSTRGVAGAENHTVSEIFAERTPLYERYADITIEADGLSIGETVDVIFEKIKAHI